MKEIPLTQGQVALVANEHFEYLNQWKWYCTDKRGKYYARRSVWLGNNKEKKLKMHHEVWWLLHPELRGKPIQIDHKDGNGCNNQPDNLREATSTQNNRNCKKRTPNNCSSKYKGVSWSNKLRKWKAAISAGNFRPNSRKHKTIHLGFHYNEIEAAKAYDLAATKYFGEFAWLNFPPQKCIFLDRLDLYSNILAITV